MAPEKGTCTIGPQGTSATGRVEARHDTIECFAPCVHCGKLSADEVAHVLMDLHQIVEERVNLRIITLGTDTLIEGNEVFFLPKSPFEHCTGLAACMFTTDIVHLHGGFLLWSLVLFHGDRRTEGDSDLQGLRVQRKKMVVTLGKHFF